MAEGNLSEDREKFALFKTIFNTRRHRKWTQQSILITDKYCKEKITFAAVLRSYRHFQRNLSWWNTVWNTYSEKRFKQICIGFALKSVSELRSFRQRVVLPTTRSRLRSIRQRLKSFRQRPTGQFANDRYK